MTKLEKQLADALIWATTPYQIEAGGYKKIVTPALSNFFAKKKVWDERKRTSIR